MADALGGWFADELVRGMAELSTFSLSMLLLVALTFYGLRHS